MVRMTPVPWKVRGQGEAFFQAVGRKENPWTETEIKYSWFSKRWGKMECGKGREFSFEVKTNERRVKLWHWLCCVTSGKLQPCSSLGFHFSIQTKGHTNPS
jgi:hypothetical protein